MERLPLLCLCVLTWSATTFADVNRPEIIKVKEGSDVTLPCSITGNIESKRFVWKKDGQKDVFFYDSGPYSGQGLSGQSDQFKGRVSHFSGELKNGNASIMIRNTKVADRGNYTCEFQHLPNQKFLMKLLVGAAPEPSITTLDQTSYWALLQCVVRGASPKPKVEFKNKAGKILDAEVEQDSEREGRYNITLKIKVTKTDTYRCVATQEEIRHQIHSETYVHLSGEKSAGTREIAAWTVAVLAVVVLVGVCVCYRRNRRFG